MIRAFIAAIFFWWSQPTESYDITIDFTRDLCPESITLYGVESKREPEVRWDWWSWTEKHYIFVYTHNRRIEVTSDKDIIYIKNIKITKHQWKE